MSGILKFLSENRRNQKYLSSKALLLSDDFSQKRMVQLAQRRRVRVPPLSYTLRELEQINMLEGKQELLLPRASSLKQLSSLSLSNAGEDGSKPSLIFQKIQCFWLGKERV